MFPLQVPVTKKNKKGGAAVVTKDKVCVLPWQLYLTCWSGGSCYQERGVIKPKKTKVEDEGKNKTDWEIIKWEELGTTKDERYCYSSKPSLFHNNEVIHQTQEIMF